MAEENLFTKDALPTGTYQRFRKTYKPLAIKVTGTFHCETSEGNIASCTDGWLAVDSRGYPYPINTIEFDETYELVDEADSDDVA